MGTAWQGANTGLIWPARQAWVALSACAGPFLMESVVVVITVSFYHLLYGYLGTLK